MSEERGRVETGVLLSMSAYERKESRFAALEGEGGCEDCWRGRGMGPPWAEAEAESKEVAVGVICEELVGRG